MAFKFTYLLAILVAVLQLGSQTDAHSRLLHPKARNPGYLGAFDTFVSPACGGRNGSKANARQQDARYRRGQSIPVVWPRNNHPGGFIKLAIVPLSSKQTQADFDKNVVQYSCHESGCKSAYPANPLGGDNTPVDGNRCSTQLTIPEYLPDGEYTLQWYWYAGGVYFGSKFQGQTDYWGCHDFTLAGGAAFNPNKKPTCPPFIAGDAHNPASAGRCKYFGKGTVLGCRPDGCKGTYKDGRPKELDACLAGNREAGGNEVEQAPTNSATLTQRASTTVSTQGTTTVVPAPTSTTMLDNLTSTVPPTPGTPLNPTTTTTTDQSPRPTAVPIRGNLDSVPDAPLPAPGSNPPHHHHKKCKPTHGY